MAPKIVDKEKKRREILEASVALFASRGVASTKMQDIAEAAGIGKGTIYEYFESKTDLFNQLFIIFSEGILTEMQVEIDKCDNAVQKIEMVMYKDVEMNRVHSDQLGLMFEFWTESVREHGAIGDTMKLHGMMEEYKALVAGILEEGIEAGDFREVDVTETARFIIGALDGVSMHYMMFKEYMSLSGALKSVSDVIMHGICSEQGIVKISEI